MFHPDIKSDFPILQTEINNHRLCYLDNAATSQKPRSVVDRMSQYYYYENANVHRGYHQLSARATQLYEKARQRIADFIGAQDSRSIVFTKNATEAINLVAYAWGNRQLKSGKNIVTSVLEHHSNIVPWQRLIEQKKADLRFTSIDKAGHIDYAHLAQLVDDDTALLALTSMSNILGSITDLDCVRDIVHSYKTPWLLDACQQIAHIPIDVSVLDCDFMVFSAHKLYGPTGLGVLYVHPRRWDQMEPFLTGGGMIERVEKFQTSWSSFPQMFEAGTPAIAETVGFQAALDYVDNLGMAKISEHEFTLLSSCIEKLSALSNVQIYGYDKATHIDHHRYNSIVSFSVDGIHAHDIATFLNEYGVAVRSGHHCGQILMAELGVSATVRLSVGLYNTQADIDSFITALHETITRLRR